MIMAWVAVALSAFLALVIFLHTVRNIYYRFPYSGELCSLYLLEHMLPDGHPFEFMYKGLPRTEFFPRLFWPCMSTFAVMGIALVSAVLAVVLSANGVLGSEPADTIFFCTSIGSAIAVDLGLMAIPAIQNKICFKRMFKTKNGLGFNVREEIEKKWPGFYKTGK